MLSDYTQMLDVIKTAAKSAVGNDKPFAFTFGQVQTVAPLTVMVDQKLLLNEAQLLLTTGVKDHTVSMSFTHTTGENTHTHEVKDKEGESCTVGENTHSHSYGGTKSFLVHKGLKIGEKVLLLRVQGGQQYIVLDRVV